MAGNTFYTIAIYTVVPKYLRIRRFVCSPIIGYFFLLLAVLLSTRSTIVFKNFIFLLYRIQIDAKIAKRNWTFHEIRKQYSDVILWNSMNVNIPKWTTAKYQQVYFGEAFLLQAPQRNSNAFVIKKVSLKKIFFYQEISNCLPIKVCLLLRDVCNQKL